MNRQPLAPGPFNREWKRLALRGFEIDLGEDVKICNDDWTHAKKDCTRAFYRSGFVIPPQYELAMRAWPRTILWADPGKKPRFQQRTETVVLYDVKIMVNMMQTRAKARRRKRRA